MTPRQQFKAAFISRCIDSGITDPSEMLNLVKSAVLGMDAAAGKVVDAGKSLAGYGTALALVAPPVIGAAGGALAARATDLPPEAMDQAKQQETIDEYRRQSERLRREGALRRYSATPGPGFRSQSLL